MTQGYIYEKTSTFISKKMVEWHCFAFLQIPLMSVLIEVRWILISGSVFSLLWYHTLRDLWKTPLYTLDRMRVKRQIKASYFHINKFNIMGLLKMSWDLQESLGHTLRMTDLYCKNTGYKWQVINRKDSNWRWGRKWPVSYSYKWK